MYPPNPPTDGIYRVKLLSVKQDNAAYYIRYDISVGPCVGWATYMYQQTGKWPLIWRLDKQKGAVAIRYAVEALNHSTHANVQSLSESTGHHICLELHRQSHIDVKRSLPLTAYTIAPDDIRVGTEGGWRKGYPNWTHALLLANLSGLPVLYADNHEILSPMVDWCAEHNIIILPQIFPVGDYTTGKSEVIVDRKDNIKELYMNFAISDNRKSYENAALLAQVAGKRLVYVIGTERDDNVNQISDLQHWGTTIKSHSLSGTGLAKQLCRHQEIYPNVSFIFAQKDEVCQTIWNMVSD